MQSKQQVKQRKEGQRKKKYRIRRKATARRILKRRRWGTAKMYKKRTAYRRRYQWGYLIRKPPISHENFIKLLTKNQGEPNGVNLITKLKYYAMFDMKSDQNVSRQFEWITTMQFVMKVNWNIVELTHGGKKCCKSTKRIKMQAETSWTLT